MVVRRGPKKSASPEKRDFRLKRWILTLLSLQEVPSFSELLALFVTVDRGIEILAKLKHLKEPFKYQEPTHMSLSLQVAVSAENIMPRPSYRFPKIPPSPPAPIEPNANPVPPQLPIVTVPPADNTHLFMTDEVIEVEEPTDSDTNQGV